MNDLISVISYLKTFPAGKDLPSYKIHLHSNTLLYVLNRTKFLKLVWKSSKDIAKYKYVIVQNVKYLMLLTKGIQKNR
jgi:hypothetical protein